MRANSCLVGKGGQILWAGAGVASLVGKGGQMLRSGPRVGLPFWMRTGSLLDTAGWALCFQEVLGPGREERACAWLLKQPQQRGCLRRWLELSLLLWRARCTNCLTRAFRSPSPPCGAGPATGWPASSLPKPLFPSPSLVPSPSVVSPTAVPP